MPKFEKLKPLKSTIIGYLHCGYTADILPLKTRLYQGMGGYMITKNGKLFFMEDSNKEFHEAKTLQYIENKARKEPDNDWRCILDLPLRSAEYQRQDKNKWVLVKTGMGFA